jgi:hypothetical protein
MAGSWASNLNKGSIPDDSSVPFLRAWDLVVPGLPQSVAVDRVQKPQTNSRRVGEFLECELATFLGDTVKSTRVLEESRKPLRTWTSGAACVGSLECGRSMRGPDVLALSSHPVFLFL